MAERGIFWANVDPHEKIKNIWTIFTGTGGEGAVAVGKVQGSPAMAEAVARAMSQHYPPNEADTREWEEARVRAIDIDAHPKKRSRKKKP